MRGREIEVAWIGGEDVGVLGMSKGVWFSDFMLVYSLLCLRILSGVSGEYFSPHGGFLVS